MRNRSALTLAIVAAAFAFASTANADPSADVIGGTDVTHSEYTTSYPYMVGLMAAQHPNAQFCGGTLIAPQWVMTAAHCYAPAEGANPAFIRIGSEDRLVGGQYVPVVGHVIHPGWNPSYLSNDIMLLRLAHAPSPATPAVRSSAVEDPIGGDLATLIGWGLTTAGDNANSSRMLKSATLDVVDQTECEVEWAVHEGIDFVTNKQICAIHYDTGSGARSGCNGDSGGPLIFASKVIGIVSFGYSGCYDYAPNVFTRVSAYNSWIDSVRLRTLTPSPESLSFGTLDATLGATDRIVKFRSDGDNSINITGVNSSGDFTIKSNSCGGLLAPQAYCSVELTFDPTGVGARVGELVVSSDSVASPAMRIRLDGFGTAKASVPVALELSIPHKSKVKRGKVMTKFNVKFLPPPAANSPAACGGLVRLSLKIPKIKKRVVKTGSMGWSVKGCSVTLTARMPKRAKGKKAKATVSFAGNNDVTATTIMKTIKIR